MLLTEEGHGIIALAEQMEEGALAMERRLAGQEQTLKGNLRISSADWFGAYVLPPILADFSKAYPNVDVEILTGTRLFNLAQREADVAFRIVPFDTADVVQRRLFRLEYGVYIAEEAADPEYGDGTGFRLITHETSTGHFLTSRGSSRVSPPPPNARPRSCDRTTATSRGACAGKASASPSCPAWSAMRIPGIRRLELPTPPPTREIWMGYHRDLRRLKRLRAFISTVSDHLVNATA